MKFTKRQWLFSAALYFLFPTTGYTAQVSKSVAKTIPVTFLSLGLLFFTSGCASMGNSMLLGGGIGAATGTGVGLAAFGHAKGTLISAATGAAVGTFLGWLLHKKDNKDLQVSDPSGSLKPGELPFLTRPDVRKVWIPDAIDGNRYIQGHSVFLIERGSVWSK
jgi:hypothetical protein